MALLAGCGGASKAATKPNFVAKANAICSSLAQQLKEVGSVRVQGGFEAKLEEGEKVLERSTAELRKIPLPPHDNVAREWLHYREAATAAAKRVIEVSPASPIRKTAAEEEFKARQQAAALARSYGLTDCLAI